MKNYVFTFVILYTAIIVNTAFAESLYECGGVIQNRPCTAKQSGRELTNLPVISRYSREDVKPSVDDSARARPRPDSFQVPNGADSEKAKDAPSSISKESAFENLLSKSERVRTGLTSGSMSVPEAESETIRLKALLETICSKQLNYNPRWDATCRKSRENLQVALSAVRDAKTRS